jgi:hypothetical protein
MWTAAVGLILTSPVQAANYYVAQGNPKASDDGPGTAGQPWKSLSKAAAVVSASDRVTIEDGVYREQVVIKAAGSAQQPIRFEAAPGAHVEISGADRLTGWERREPGRPVCRIRWPHRFIGWSQHMTHPDDEYHRVIGRCEQVMIEGYALRQVLLPEQLAPGTFCADTENHELIVWDDGGRDLNKLFVEGSVRTELLRVEGAFVEIRGIRFRYAANMAQHGAVNLGGAHDVLEDCVVDRMNASGATFTGEQQVVRRCVFRDNGQLGFGANGAHHLFFTECTVENNNTKNYDRGWEAGGDKLVLCRDAILDRCQFVRNHGNGVWFDIGNEHCTVRQCFIADNEDAGIFDEISYGLQAHDNVITGNGFASTPGAWGAQAGITLSSSPDSLIERNLIVGNREGFNFREQTRTTPRIGKPGEIPVWNHDETIHHNVIALNRDAQIWGWFDMPDNRHWPRVEGSRPTSRATNSDPTKQPEGLALADLHLRFEGNVYFAGDSRGLFVWGTSWGRHKRYMNLDEFRAELGIDTNSQTRNPDLQGFSARDFRLSHQIHEQLQLNYPRGPVPGCLLGER